MGAGTEEKSIRILAEQIKLPLVQIVHNLSGEAGVEKAKISARNGIRLIDGYLLSAELHNQTALELEPVSVGAVLYDTSEELREYASLYNCSVSIKLSSKMPLVMSDYLALKSALGSISSALIENIPSQENGGSVLLEAHKSQSGVVLGVYSDHIDINSEDLKKALALEGSSRQPFSRIMSGPASGIFIANNILSAIATPLEVSKLSGLKGLSTLLSPSRQLAMV